MFWNQPKNILPLCSQFIVETLFVDMNAYLRDVRSTNRGWGHSITRFTYSKRLKALVLNFRTELRSVTRMYSAHSGIDSRIGRKRKLTLIITLTVILTLILALTLILILTIILILTLNILFLNLPLSKPPP